MLCKLPSFASFALASILLASLFTGGCATIDRKSTLDLADIPGAPAAEVPECTIVLQPGRGKPDVVKMPLTEGATVQTALDHSKATKRFRRMDIHVLRTSPGRGSSPGRVQKMNVKFNRPRRKVEIDHDYALYPNDRVVIEEDTSTILDELVEKVGGQMGLPIARNLVR
jgi:hypothetical protein